mmetsp:Transcript_115019/g.330426  ORF Transcript_115019/g.330426 Transcript_115019/m.330426 type:complete len:304 (-) Transcript_115019:913-1824(-)
MRRLIDILGFSVCSSPGRGTKCVCSGILSTSRTTDSKVDARRETKLSQSPRRQAAMRSRSSRAVAWAVCVRAASDSMSSFSLASALGFESPGLRRCSCAALCASRSDHVEMVAAWVSFAPRRSSSTARAVSSPNRASPRFWSASSRSWQLQSRRARAASMRDRSADSFISSKNFAMKSGTAPLKVSLESFCASVTMVAISASKVPAFISFPRTISKQPERKACSVDFSSSPDSAATKTSDSRSTRICGTPSSAYLLACSTLKARRCVPKAFKAQTAMYSTPTSSPLKTQGSPELLKNSRKRKV